MGSVEINQSEIKKLKRQYILRERDKIIKIAPHLLDSLRKQYTKEWCRDNKMDYDSLIKSIEVDYEYIDGHNGAEFIFHSYINPDIYPIEHTNLYKRIHKNSDLYGGNLNPTRFIVQVLQWKNGIIGLPKNASKKYNPDSIWRNPVFRKADITLENWISNKLSHNWTVEFNKEYIKKYGK